MSAMVPVVLTRAGRRLARRVCMTSYNDIYSFYFTSTTDGTVTNVFMSSDGSRWYFRDGETFPEFEFSLRD